MIKVVNGKKLALEKERTLKQKVRLLNQREINPAMAVLFFENDRAGRLYSKLKQEAGKRIGIRVIRMPVNSKRQLKNMLVMFSKDKKIDGIVVQYPGLGWAKKILMSKNKFIFWWQKLIKRIPRHKDIDGLRDDSGFDMGAVKAVEEILKRYAQKGRAAIVGAKGFTGRKIITRLDRLGYVVKGLDIRDDLKIEAGKADILITATGVKNLIKSEMVKKGAMVIDLGWPEAEVDFEAVKKRAGVITPVPGGVGPLTVVNLLENLVNKW